jgi:NAD(P)-dependent dehydrogenase (short-subunit alcohol dehydrogenase family)
MFRYTELGLPGSCDRIVVDVRGACIEALLDDADAPNDTWAFGIVRRETSLGPGAWAYLDGFDRVRRLRVHLDAPPGWAQRFRALAGRTDDELLTAEMVAGTQRALASSRRDRVHAPIRPTNGTVAGKVALVTGASRGIGAAIAKRLASQGATVAVTARTLDRQATNAATGTEAVLADTVSWIRHQGGTAEPFLADLSDTAAAQCLVGAVVERFGPVDILVNNAARAAYRPVEQWEPTAVQKLFNVNVLSPLVLASRVIPQMKQRGFGAIVNVSSIVAAHPIGPPYGLFERASLSTVYSMAKAALDRLSTGVAVECVDWGVQVNSISPSGGVRTAGALAASNMFNGYPEYAEPVETIAEAVLALCEPREPMITGRVMTSGALLADLERPVRALDGGPFLDPLVTVDLRDDSRRGGDLARGSLLVEDGGRVPEALE